MKNKGFVKTIILVVIALIILGYFGYDIKDIINSEKVKGNLNYVWGFVKTFWNNYLEAPVMLVWDKFIIGVLWKFIENYKN